METLLKVWKPLLYFIQMSLVLLLFLSHYVSFSLWQVKQFPESLAAQKDSEVILNCFVTGDTTPSKVKWLRQDIVKKTHIFSQRPEAHESNDPRMDWALKCHTINYALHITNITFTDTGTYYCVAYGGGDGRLHNISGKGTYLRVKGMHELHLESFSFHVYW
uniref:Ig-like domain-containing protein n=1 Tax=Erpetoichthys calabaricus TaxID=27687 RepID=A0A8C4SDN5_ERPCA